MPTQPYATLDGKPVPGVTTIIGAGLAWGQPALMQWAEKCGREGKSHVEERDRAARIGTITHARIEAYLGGAPVDLATYAPEEVTESEAPFKAFVEWKKGVALRVRRLEAALVSEEYRYGGTLDIDGILGEHGAILDLKTSSQIRPSNLIQLAAYRQLWRENVGYRAPLPKCVLIHIPRGCKRAKILTVKPDALDHAWTVFHALLRIYHAQSNLALKVALEP